MNRGGFLNSVFILLAILALATWVASTIGAALVSFFKKGEGQMSHIILGFAAGIMLAAGFFELLLPAFEMAEYSAWPGWIIVLAGFLVGCFGIMGLDIILRRMVFAYKQSSILAGAISIHNLPEGFAIGVLLGALPADFRPEELALIIPIILAIGLHNIPEGTAVAISFRREGASKTSAFFLGQIAGLAELLAGILGFFIVTRFDAIMPAALSFAAGAMVWVAVHELIPECQKNKEHHPYLATIGIIIGVALMLILPEIIGV